MRRRFRAGGGARRAVLALLALCAAPVAGWVTLRFGATVGLGLLALGGAALCVAASRRG